MTLLHVLIQNVNKASITLWDSSSTRVSPSVVFTMYLSCTDMLVLIYQYEDRSDVCVKLVPTPKKLQEFFVSKSFLFRITKLFEPRHEISNTVVCATSTASDQPAHTQSDQSLC